MNLCKTCRHAHWFEKGKTGGLCRHPFTLDDIKMPHAIYFFQKPHLARIALHKQSTGPKECIGYEYLPKPEGK